MPTMKEIREQSLIKRTRSCEICGTSFVVRDVSAVAATCSKICQKTKRSNSMRAFRENNPEAEDRRKAAAADGIRRWNADNPELASLRGKERMKVALADSNFVAKSKAALRKHQLKRSAEAKTKRERQCLICGVHFIANSATALGLCSRACQDQHFSAKRTGYTQSEETKAKRAQAIKEWQTNNPELNAARLEAIKAAQQSESYRIGAAQRYEKMRLSQSGLFSAETIAAKNEVNKWVMSKARKALDEETDFIELWTATQEQLRLEMPFLGDEESPDYHEYCRRLGKALTAHPAIITAISTFMKEAIPRFHAEWREGAAAKEKVETAETGVNSDHTASP